MSKNSTKLELLKEIMVREHGLTNVCLEELLSSKNPKVQLNWLKQNAVLKHQYNEEKLIFTKLLKKERLKEGGPFCVLFFDEHVISPPAQLVKKYTTKDLTYCEHQDVFKKDRSPLEIPLEEHVALENLLQSLLAKPDENLIDHPALVLLETLFHRHHEKEEKCFLKICESLLLPHEIDEILSLWIPMTEYRS
ncbi:hypothetical protein [Pseudobdellovibrio sp. HCB154]|uniref:hypothetical protein n=1 Tax=Pseudobdellovibrio sp. HCB154 TaxID=3386277 RepID=UPI003916EE8D